MECFWDPTVVGGSLDERQIRTHRSKVRLPCDFAFCKLHTWRDRATNPRSVPTSILQLIQPRLTHKFHTQNLSATVSYRYPVAPHLLLI